MANAIVSDFLHRIKREVEIDVLSQHSDRELVEQALAGQNQSAFEAIVCRYGALVYRVCWRVLGHAQDTEDAFQTTFLILAQKLTSLRKHESLASWLHGIALRVARKARTTLGVQRRRERELARSERQPEDDDVWHKMTTLDEEIARLPDRWRQPVLLCYLQGQTQAEAARRLRCSERTLRRRLSEGLQALGNRLSRRGVVWSGSLASLLVFDAQSWGALPTELLTTTAKISADVADGQLVAHVASTQVAHLTGVMMRIFLVTKLKWLAIGLFVVGIFGASVGLVADDGVHQHPLQPKKERAGTELEGTWRVDSVVLNDKVQQPQYVSYLWTFRGDRVTTAWVHKDNTAGGGTNKFVIDAKKKLKELTVTGERVRLQAIYKLEKNQLTLAYFGRPETARPQGFSLEKSGTPPGQSFMVFHLKREQKMK